MYKLCGATLGNELPTDSTTSRPWAGRNKLARLRPNAIKHPRSKQPTQRRSCLKIEQGQEPSGQLKDCCATTAISTHRHEAQAHQGQLAKWMNSRADELQSLPQAKSNKQGFATAEQEHTLACSLNLHATADPPNTAHTDICCTSLAERRPSLKWPSSVVRTNGGRR